LLVLFKEKKIASALIIYDAFNKNLKILKKRENS
jgi:hypothetical protein